MVSRTKISPLTRRQSVAPCSNMSTLPRTEFLLHMKQTVRGKKIFCLVSTHKFLNFPAFQLAPFFFISKKERPLMGPVSTVNSMEKWGSGLILAVLQDLANPRRRRSKLLHLHPLSKISLISKGHLTPYQILS